jgi:hypothetical protein
MPKVENMATHSRLHPEKYYASVANRILYKSMLYFIHSSNSPMHRQLQPFQTK